MASAFEIIGGVGTLVGIVSTSLLLRDRWKRKTLRLEYEHSALDKSVTQNGVPFQAVLRVTLTFHNEFDDSATLRSFSAQLETHDDNISFAPTGGLTRDGVRDVIALPLPIDGKKAMTCIAVLPLNLSSKSGSALASDISKLTGKYKILIEYEWAHGNKSTNEKQEIDFDVKAAFSNP